MYQRWMETQIHLHFLFITAASKNKQINASTAFAGTNFYKEVTVKSVKTVFHEMGSLHPHRFCKVKLLWDTLRGLLQSCEHHRVSALSPSSTLRVKQKSNEQIYLPNCVT